MTDFQSSIESTAQARWHRFSAEAVRLFHVYANWLVGISWKRFFVLAVLLLITMAMLSNVPPFRWSITEVLDAPPEPKGVVAPKPPPPEPPEPPAAKKVPDVRIDKSGVRIEAPNSNGDDNVVISIDKNGVRITPHIRAASGAAAGASAASPASAEFHASAAFGASAASAATVSSTSAAGAASVAASAPDDSEAITIKLPPGADVAAIKEAVREGLAQAREAAAEAARDAKEAAADAAAELKATHTQRRTRIVRYGDFLTDFAALFIAASAILKITYKGRMQAEVKAAAATETAESEQLKRQVVEARMAAMQAQVEPHFLFNTLASIDHLIETDPARASQMQKNLIALLRASMPTMREAHPTAHNLGREMAVIRPYLEILKVRMEDRLQTEISVPDGLLSADFPAMMIQSLVENAIKHGLEPKAEGGKLSVRAEVNHGKLAVTVADTGLGFGKAATAGTGVGLANIRERLQLVYGNKASMVVTENLPTGTLVTLTVPYQAQAREGETA
jgi:hypothetical protein